LFLLVAVASAHAFIGSLAVAAIIAGLYLYSLKRAVFFISAVIAAAGNTAADMGIGLFLRHNGPSKVLFCAQNYFARPDKKHAFASLRRFNHYFTCKCVDIFRF